jgi:5-carboxymethyl-2-hydroxymuconate isomerase
MPNLVLEYSANLILDVDETLQRVNAAIAGCKVFDDDDIKTRATRFERYLVGSEGRGDGFAHLRISMGPRDAETEGRIADAAIAAMQATIRVPEGVRAQLCVEVLHVVMPPYRKRAAGEVGSGHPATYCGAAVRTTSSRK